MGSQTIPKKTIKANYIVKSARKIAVINGYLFYQSTGHNSGFRETWFPFMGINVHDSKRDHLAFFPLGMMPQGWFIKPPAPTEQLSAFLKEHCPEHQYHELPKRFSSMPSMCVSANIGGGFWDTQRGKKIKGILVEQNPEFFENIKFKFNGVKNLDGQILVKTVKFSESNHLGVNDWALDQTAIKQDAYRFKLLENLSQIWKTDHKDEIKMPYRDIKNATTVNEPGEQNTQANNNSHSNSNHARPQKRNVPVRKTNYGLVVMGALVATASFAFLTVGWALLGALIGMGMIYKGAKNTNRRPYNRQIPKSTVKADHASEYGFTDNLSQPLRWTNGVAKPQNKDASQDDIQTSRHRRKPKR